jgi:hypothetical protein
MTTKIQTTLIAALVVVGVVTGAGFAASVVDAMQCSAKASYLQSEISAVETEIANLQTDPLNYAPNGSQITKWRDAAASTVCW